MRLTQLALGALLSIGACVPAVAQVAPPTGGGREFKVGLSTTVTQDSNINHANALVANTRGLSQADTTLQPALRISVVEPVGRQILFLRGTAGYDFHRRNPQLNRQRIDLGGGGVIVTSACQATVTGNFAAAQSDLADATLGTVKNLQTTKDGSAGLTCAQGSSFGELLMFKREQVSNSVAIQKTADHRSDTINAGLTYGNPSVGSLSFVAALSQQTYPHKFTSTGLNQAGAATLGDGYKTRSLGLTYQRKFGSKLTASINGGVTSVKRRMAPPGIPLTYTAASYAASVDEQLTSRIGLQASVSRGVSPSNRPGKLYDTQTQWNGGVNYKLGSRFLITVGASLADSNSNADTSVAAVSLTKSRTKTGSFGVRYRQNDKATLSFNVRHDDRKANLPIFDYTDTRASVTLDLSY